jgi:hypothetical protein
MVDYRHDILRDLENQSQIEYLRTFAKELQEMRGHLSPDDKLHYDRQKESRFLDAVEIYYIAVQPGSCTRLSGVRLVIAVLDRLAGASCRFTVFPGDRPVPVDHRLRLHDARQAAAQLRRAPTRWDFVGISP